MHSQPSWEEMLEGFRAMGGTAENIAMENGELCPRDPERPVILRVPESLLFPPESLEFAEGSLRLRDRGDASPATRTFIERYEADFGPAFFAQAAAAIDALDSLPVHVKDLLSTDFDMRDSFEGERTGRIERRVVEMRAIRTGEGRMLAPVLELAKHDPKGLAIEHAAGMRIAGFARDGVRISHPFHDALAIFRRFGFAAAQPAAFSLPLRFASDGVEITIGRKLHLGDRRGEVTVPQLNVVTRDRLALSHLMTGHSEFPRLARAIFHSRMRDADVQNADEQFDRITRENTARLLKLLDVLEEEEGHAALSLRRMARHQLEAMSWSVGTAEI